MTNAQLTTLLRIASGADPNLIGTTDNRVARRMMTLLKLGMLQRRKNGGLEISELGRDKAAVRARSAGGPRQVLVVEFPVTGWTDDQISALTQEVCVQGEDNDAHPEAKATTRVVRSRRRRES
jgi:hypothetical protein